MCNDKLYVFRIMVNHYIPFCSTCAGLLTLFTSACYLRSSQQRTLLHRSDRHQFVAQVNKDHFLCVCVNVSMHLLK